VEKQLDRDAACDAWLQHSLLKGKAASRLHMQKSAWLSVSTNPTSAAQEQILGL